MYLILAFLTGFSIVITTILNGKLAEKIGTINGIIVNYSMGLITSILLCLIMRENIYSIKALSTSPMYYFLGGFVGVAVIFLFNIVVPKIPAVYVVILPFVGQILTSAIIDYFYLDIFSKGKIVGGILFLVGLLYNARVDKKSRHKNMVG